MVNSVLSHCTTFLSAILKVDFNATWPIDIAIQVPFETHSNIYNDH